MDDLIDDSCFAITADLLGRFLADPGCRDASTLSNADATSAGPDGAGEVPVAISLDETETRRGLWRALRSITAWRRAWYSFASHRGLRPM